MDRKLQQEVDTYGKIATSAYIILEACDSSSKPLVEPLAVWHQFASEAYPKSHSSATKGCPKSAFLGLAQEGYLKGIPADQYTRSRLNKDYAIVAATMLLENPGLAQDKLNLWTLACGDRNKVHNSQMDVVLALLQLGALTLPD